MKTAVSIIFCAVLFAGGVRAQTESEARIAALLVQARQAQLDRHPTWLRLLNYPATPQNGAASDIISPEFFNSSDGRTRPDLELEATLLAFFADAGEEPERHALCRFPARYYWLDSVLDIPHQLLPRVSCSRLENWARFDRLDSISLIMVSGYFGNPASSFGHILIKLNNSGNSPSGDLLDEGVNFGALVPENEPTAVYIMKGLFGGYVGGFSDKKFYTHDLIYTETQFRDMWEYELNLDEREKRLFVYHLWELVGMKYVYYFLEENCGYRVAKVLELATGADAAPATKPWFLPIDLFHAIDDINATQHPGIIRQIRFRPSSQRSLYRNFALLDTAQARTVNTLIETPDRLEQGALRGFPERSQAQMLDVLLEYNNYKIAAYDEDDERIPVLADGKNSLLSQRLQLPVFDAQEPAQDGPVPSPSSGSRPGLVRVGAGHHEEFGTTLTLGFAAVHYDAVGNVNGSLRNSEMKIFDLTVGANDDEGAFLDHLDLISIQKIALDKTGLSGESSPSWRISTGVRRKDLSCVDCLAFYMTGGPGRAFRLTRNLIGYGMFDVHLQSRTEHLALSPAIGLIAGGATRWKALLEAGQRINRNDRDGKTLLNIESRYSLSTDDEIRFSYDRYRESEYQLSYYHYW